MGRFAVLEHAGNKITLSMIKFGLPRRILFHIAKKLRLVDRFEFAVFTPKYEIAVFDGGREAVYSLHTPPFVFYYPDAGTANKKWGELVTVLEEGGLHGDQLIDFIRNAHPREQGLNAIGVEKALNNFFREAYGEGRYH
jgi:hypothetical protein